MQWGLDRRLNCGLDKDKTTTPHTEDQLNSIHDLVEWAPDNTGTYHACNREAPRGCEPQLGQATSGGCQGSQIEPIRTTTVDASCTLLMWKGASTTECTPAAFVHACGHTYSAQKAL